MPSHPIVQASKVRLALYSAKFCMEAITVSSGMQKTKNSKNWNNLPGELREASTPITFKGQICRPTPKINRKDFRFLFINSLPHTKSADKKYLYIFI